MGSGAGKQHTEIKSKNVIAKCENVAEVLEAAGLSLQDDPDQSTSASSPVNSRPQASFKATSPASESSYGYPAPSQPPISPVASKPSTSRALLDEDEVISYPAAKKKQPKFAEKAGAKKPVRITHKADSEDEDAPTYELSDDGSISSDDGDETGVRAPILDDPKVDFAKMLKATQERRSQDRMGWIKSLGVAEEADAASGSLQLTAHQKRTFETGPKRSQGTKPGNGYKNIQPAELPLEEPDIAGQMKKWNSLPAHTKMVAGAKAPTDANDPLAGSSIYNISAPNTFGVSNPLGGDTSDSAPLNIDGHISQPSLDIDEEWRFES